MIIDFFLLFSAIEIEDESQPWAAAGSNVTVYLTSIDPVHISIGTVLCPLTDTIPLVSVFTAKIIVFDIQIPITAGTSVCPTVLAGWGSSNSPHSG